MHRRPEQADRAAEVVQHEVRALDPKFANRRVEPGLVALNRVGKIDRLVGASEAGQVDRDAAPEFAQRRRELLKVAARARDAVQEDDRFGAVGCAPLGDQARDTV